MVLSNSGLNGEECDALLLGQRHTGDSKQYIDDDEDLLDELIVAYNELRHVNNGIPKEQAELARWRIRVRMRTICVGLIVALNIGVDPPDIFKTSPCARSECGLDIHTLPPNKALEQVGQRLQQQYDKLNSRQGQARYKVCLDPTVDDVKKTCTALRRCAKDERVLIHYNGHGVPRPTDCGEIWLFNKNFTQYIPLSLYEMQSYIGSPSIFVWDCSNAGQVVISVEQFAQQRRQEYEGTNHRNAGDHVPQPPLKDCIHLAACGQDEVLPMSPDLPADLFTACLTTPIEVVFNMLQNNTSKLLLRPRQDMLSKMEGSTLDRRTLVGELLWLFTAITDTIAWNVLPRDLFQKLFRQDLLVASLFRNFLLAERIMRSVGCTPVSHPALPSTYQHPMWQHWDMALDLIMASGGQLQRVYDQCYFPFFSDQLKAFEVWLSLGSQERDPPEQLPIVLQVLLSQTHRLRALQLLQQFLDLGPWAVNLALSVGIFPYVLKLLQSSAPEIRNVMCFIWCKILAADKTCQADILKDGGQKYFVEVLCNPKTPELGQVMACYCLSVIMEGHPSDQEACVKESLDLITRCASLLSSRSPSDPGSPLVRRWLLLCLSKLWEGNMVLKQKMSSEGVHTTLYPLLKDDVPEVRAACIYALGTLVGVRDDNGPIVASDIDIAVNIVSLILDASPLVRKEVVFAVQNVVKCYVEEIKTVAINSDKDQRLSTPLPANNSSSPVWKNRSSHGVPISPAETQATNAPFVHIYHELLNLSIDPFQEVSDLTKAVMAEFGIPGRKRQPIRSPVPKKAVTVTVSTGNLIRTFSSKALNWLSDVGEANPSDVTTPPDGGPWSSRHGSANSIRRTYSVKSDAPRTSVGRDSNIEEENMAGLSSNVGTDSQSKKPLISQFYEWSSDYLRHPLLRPNSCGIDTLSDQYLLRKFWSRRHKKHMQQGETLAAYTLPTARVQDGTVVKQRATLRFQASNGQMPGQLHKIVFHPSLPELCVADSGDTINVYNWKGNGKQVCFSNRNAPGAHISDMKYAIAQDTPRLLLASDDGVVRVWRDYADPALRSVVTSWRALSDLLAYRTQRESGMLLDWHQIRGWVGVAGDCGYMRFWDAEKEMCAQLLETRSDTSATAMGHNPVSPNVVYAGFADGCVRLYDLRDEGRVVLSFNEHPSRIQSGCFQHNNTNHLVTGSIDSTVCIWDGRASHSLAMVEAHPNVKQLSSFAVHPYAPVFTSGTWAHQPTIKDHAIRLFHMSDLQPLSTIQYHEGFLGQRIASVTALAFHPYKTVFAAGGADTIVSVYDFNQ